MIRLDSGSFSLDLIFIGVDKSKSQLGFGDFNDLYYADLDN